MEKFYKRLRSFLLSSGFVFCITYFKLEWHILFCLWLAVGIGVSAVVAEGCIEELIKESKARASQELLS